MQFMNFVEAVEHHSMYVLRNYFFTATRKHSLTPFKIGMNDTDIFGQVICNVKAPKLVRQGYISPPPKVKIKKFDILEDKEDVAERDHSTYLETLDDNNIKESICARSTKQIIRLFTDWILLLVLRIVDIMDVHHSKDRCYQW